MRRVTVTELKNRLSKYLRLVKQGETIEVLERSVPIARLERLAAGASAEDRLRRLVRDGIVARAKRRGAKKLLKLPPLPCTRDPVRVLVEQRGDR